MSMHNELDRLESLQKTNYYAQRLYLLASACLLILGLIFVPFGGWDGFWISMLSMAFMVSLSIYNGFVIRHINRILRRYGRPIPRLFE